MKKFKEFMNECILDDISDEIWHGNIYEKRVSVIDIYQNAINKTLNERKIVKIPYTQPWMNKIEGKSHSEVYNVAFDMAKDAKPELNRILRAVAVGKTPKVTINMKKHDSFVDKTFFRGKSFNIDDVIRAAILVDNEDDLNATIKNIYKKTTVIEHDVKEKDIKDEFGYYGSHHFAIKLPTSGIVVELQLMTRKLWAYKKEAHKVYKKFRTDTGDVPEDIRKKELARSRQLFNLANKK